MPEPTPPPSEERIAAYLRGEVGEAERAEIEAALDRDPQLLALVALLARADPEADGPSPPPEPDAEDDRTLVDRIEREHAARLRPGNRLGRYEIEHALGRGGMGLVYAAIDPELGRRVAIKLLRHANEEAQARLIREARALARVSDRHVITVHDVGTVEGRVFLAMELLDGQTLLEWRSAAERSWRDVVRVYVDAVRGLQAAHAAGIVHRDFKPSNVMITETGRVVVLDFGLAQAELDAEVSLPAASAWSDDEVDLTRTGQRLGTPAYMAPEQVRGEPCVPQTDLFGYCVALWEALHGSMPSQATRPSRPASFRAATGRVPAALDRALARGLSRDPERRHESMEALVDELVAVTRPRRWWIGAVGLTGAAVAAAAWPSPPPAPPAAEPCSGSARVLAETGTWDEARATAVRSALARTEMPWSERVSDEVDRRLHAYADAWTREHEAACRATRVEGTESEAVLDLRMLCLDRRRRAMGALVEVLSDIDAEGAAQAVQAVDGLPLVVGCRDLEALRAPVPLPDEPERRTRAEALFDELGRVEALRLARRYDEALSLAERAVTDAEALEHPPTEADARLALGWVLSDRGEHEAAEAELRAALHAAEEGRHDEAVALAWSRLAWVVGYKGARHDEGRRLAEHAASWGRRLGQASYLEISRLRSLGWIEHEAGNAEAALAHFEAALALVDRLPQDDPVTAQELALVLNGVGSASLSIADLERAAEAFADASRALEEQLGPDHPDVARVRNNLASLLRAQGKAAEAHDLLARNLGVFEATYGDDHPLVGQTLINLAVAELDLGRHHEAEQHADQGVAVLRAAHGPDHPMVAKAHTLRGDARVQLHRPLEALEDFELALSIERETLGPEHPSIGIIESNLGGAFYDLERFDDAAAHQLRSIEILEAGLGAEHPNVAFVVDALGLTRRSQGRLEEALHLFERAERSADASLRPTTLTHIGTTLLRLGRAEPAADALQRALDLHAEIEVDPGHVGDTRFALARARWVAHGDLEGARALAHAALEDFAEGDDAEHAAEVRGWLAEHPAETP